LNFALLYKMKYYKNLLTVTLLCEIAYWDYEVGAVKLLELVLNFSIDVPKYNNMKNINYDKNIHYH